MTVTYTDSVLCSLVDCAVLQTELGQFDTTLLTYFLITAGVRHTCRAYTIDNDCD